MTDIRHDTVDPDGGIRPMEDTGFRMRTSEPFFYFPQPNPPQKKIWDIQTVHVDDIATRRQTSIRGIDYITINIDGALARQRGVAHITEGD